MLNSDYKDMLRALSGEKVKFIRGTPRHLRETPHALREWREGSSARLLTLYMP
jgi:hypothetical protein